MSSCNKWMKEINKGCRLQTEIVFLDCQKVKSRSSVKPIGLMRSTAGISELPKARCVFVP